MTALIAPERVLTCTRCHTPTLVTDIDLTRAGGPYLNPQTYVCGTCLERGLKPAYNEFPEGY